MDFIEGLPVSEGNDKIFVVVDRLKKYAHFENIYKLHAFSKMIISDRDAKFTSNFWRELCKKNGITLNMSSAYHPQTYG